MNKKIFFLALATLFLTGCTQKAATTQREPSNVPTAPAASQTATQRTSDSAQLATPAALITAANEDKSTLVPLTPEELAKHNNKNDCWLLIEGKVYDVTAYINQHPGGEIILQGCGKDATELFNTKGGQGEGHSTKAQALLEQYYLGKLIVQ